MKKLLLPVLLILLMSTTTSDYKLTDEERRLAVSELTNSKEHLLIAVNGLSPAQLNYKTSPESWSIAENVEHLAITEAALSGMIQQLMQTPADAANRDKVSMSDHEVLALIEDRSQKIQTQKPFEPSNKFGSYDASLMAFKDARAKNIEMAKTSTEDFRNRVQEFPFGTIDGFQAVLFLAGHSERHVRQIEEVMRSPDFPKS